MGGVIIQKRENLGTNRPPPPSDISDFFEFQTYQKNADPSPLGSISDIFEFENILMAEDPQD